MFNFNKSLSIVSKLVLVFVVICGHFLVNKANAATSITYYGITWYFSADRPTGTFVNGEPWVLGPVTITSITPNPSQSTNGVQHGSMINPIPNTQFGFDSHPNVTSAVTYTASKNVALSFPFNLAIGDVLVSSIGQNIYPTYLKTVCALTVVGSTPPTGSFRPSIFGTDRTIKFNVSQMNWGVLKNYTAPPSTPTKADITAMVPPLPWFEWSAIWSGNSLQPKDNTADGDKQYGRETAAKFGHVALWLNTNQTLADKQAIAIQMVQNGIDIYEYVKNGGGFYHDGGHKCGRKLPLVLAAMMLNDATLKTWAGNPDIFQEDQQTFFVSQNDINMTHNTNYPGYVCAPYTQPDLNLAEWGIRHRYEPFYDNRTWATGYRTVVGPGMMGPWLAASIMGAEITWNHPPAFAYMQRYHSIQGNGGTNVSQQNFNNEMWGLFTGTGGTVTPVQYVATPTITPASGFFSSVQTVSMACSTPSSTIRYTLNGSVPTSTSTIYTAPFTVSATTTITAIGFASGLQPSGVATSVLNFGIAPPVFSPLPGGFPNAQGITLSSTTSGCTFRYTLDGSTPTVNSPLYTGPFYISATTTVNAIAIKPSIAPSSVSTGVYSIGALVGSPDWITVAFDPRSVQFTYGFDMTPSSSNIDAVVGLGALNPISLFSDLACAIRFNTSGNIDARNGGAYAAVTNLAYSAGNKYTVRMIVNPVNKTYDVTVSVNGGAAVQIAQNYAFRTEQANLSTLNSMALNAVTGTQTVTNYGLIPNARPVIAQPIRVVRP